MKLNKQQVQTILDNAPNGTNKKKLLDGLIMRGYEIEGVDTNQAKSELGLSQPIQQEQPVQQTGISGTISDIPSDIKQTAQGIGQAVRTRADNIADLGLKRDLGERTAVGTTLKQAGQLAGSAGDVIGELYKGAVKLALSPKGEERAKEIIQNLGEKAMEIPAVQNTLTWYDKLPDAQKEAIDATGGVLSLASEFIGAGTSKKVIGEVVDATAPVVRQGLNIAEDLTKSSVNQVANVVENAPDVLSKFIAPNVDDKFKTALKRTTKQEVSDMETIVKNATQNADNPSAFEVVGNKIADATEQVNNQIKSLAQTKKDIISKAKNGNVDFTNETGKVILDINRSLKDSTIGKQFISKLKSVKTKFQADQAIDELQDILYKGNKDLTIPTGSKEDKVLKGILGKYNSSLKEGLPASYKKINEEISKKLSSLELLNKSLGEVVDGVPIKGASLIKQYFSPSGTKAKELFEFIQKNTGYDVGKDAVLAKYMSEIYGETRARSLLQGIPTTAQGTIDKLIDFTLKKTGASDILEKATTRGSVLKAKDLAN